MADLTQEEQDKIEGFVAGFFSDVTSILSVSHTIEQAILRRRAFNESQKARGLEGLEP